MPVTVLSALQAWSHLILTRTSKLGAIVISIIHMRKVRLKGMNFPKVLSYKIQGMKPDFSDVNNYVLSLYCIACLLAYSVPGAVLEKSSFVGRFWPWHFVAHLKYFFLVLTDASLFLSLLLFSRGRKSQIPADCHISQLMWSTFNYISICFH